MDSESSQEAAHAEYPPIQHKGTEVSLFAFTSHNPLVFSGSETSEDPQGFLDKVVWMCRVLECSSTRMVDLATFCLLDITKD